ncbi:unnamed protein product [Larinioides sclopetarius]|uniref:Uncharacterized protein n=1 Tax=Larinioides sclopetarius TaxID=280406 RepID=A0AAV2BLL9_9ARAC
MDIKHNETIEKYAGNSNDNYEVMCERPQQTRNVSQASISIPDFLFSTEDIKLDEMSRDFRDQPFVLQTSFNDPYSTEEMGANLKQPLFLEKHAVAVTGPSIIRRKSFGPVRNKSYACDLCPKQFKKIVILYVIIEYTRERSPLFVTLVEKSSL